MKNDNGKLKREISKRWPQILTSQKAFAQLEYILQEAGLLARPRNRTKKEPQPNQVDLL